MNHNNICTLFDCQDQTGLAGVFDIRVGARISAYSAGYGPSELWIVDGVR